MVDWQSQQQFQQITCFGNYQRNCPSLDALRLLPTIQMDPKVTIVEVGPRDGLQNIKNQVPTEVKTELIRRLYDSGLRTIEVTSVVSPKAVPQLRDCHEVLRSKTIKQLAQAHSVRLPVLVPNIKGVKIAHGYGASEVAVFLSASEGFSRANINCTVDQGIARAREVTSEAKKLGIIVRG